MATATPGLNSYVDQAYADAYFLERFGFSSWTDIDADTKNQALISAFHTEDSLCNWYGDKTDPLQVGEFPRDGDTEAPEQIKFAQCEIAFSMTVAESSVVTEDDVLTKLSAGSVSLEFKGVGGKTGGYSDYLKSLLRPYGRCSYLGGGARMVDVMRAG